MTTQPREVVAVPDEALAFNEPALKQLAVLFNRIACPYLTPLRSIHPQMIEHQMNFGEHLLRLADTGILFEPEISKSDDQGFNKRMHQDIDEVLKPSGVSLADYRAARTDEKKALEVREKRRPFKAESLSQNDVGAIIGAMQRLMANMTRNVAVQLRNIKNFDAHAVMSSELSPWEQDDDHPDSHDLLRILVSGLPLPDKDVSWEQIIEYRSDPNTLNRFLDLRNWIRDIALGKLTPLEAEQRLQPVLTRFRKQAEARQMKTVSTSLEAYVTTSPEVLKNLLSYPGGTKHCYFRHQKLVLLEGEAPSEVSEVVFVLESTFIADKLMEFDDKSREQNVAGSTPPADNQSSN